MNSVYCQNGQYEGFQDGGCYKFLGIPYAKYNGRWDKSELLRNKNQIKAQKIGSAAPQTRPGDENHSGIGFFLDRSLAKESEDCLTLNICSNDIEASNPVMIWIHGGTFNSGNSFNSGTGANPLYDGSNIG